MLFMEVHPDPDHALSDGPNMVLLDQLDPILKMVLEFSELSAKYRSQNEFVY